MEVMKPSMRNLDSSRVLADWHPHLFKLNRKIMNGSINKVISSQMLRVQEINHSFDHHYTLSCASLGFIKVASLTLRSMV